MKHPTHPVEQEEVMAYLDGELSAERAAELAAHIEHCADCQSLAQDLRGVSSQMLTWQVEPTPGQLVAPISAAAHARKVPTSELRPGFLYGLLHETQPWRRWAWGMGSLAVIMLAGWGLYWGAWALNVMRGPNLAANESTSVDTARVQYPRDIGGNAIALIPAPSKNAKGAPASVSKNSNASSPFVFAPSEEGERAAEGGGAARKERSQIAVQLPMVARTASLAITVKDFSSARASVERIVAQLHGYLGELTTESPKDAAQILTATLHIPAPQLDAALTQIKSLGRVEQESQKGEEVSEQHADLVARLKNARATEQRLLDVLRQRTGKVSDILEVEEQISSVRQDIERMEAEQKNLETRVAYGAVQLRVTEEYKATLNFAPPSTLTSLRNAATDGYQTLVGSLLGLVLWLMSSGPVLIFWGLLLFWPARIAWRRLRGAMRQPTAA